MIIFKILLICNCTLYSYILALKLCDILNFRPKPIMPRTYKWKTDRASTPLVELDRAVKEVQQGKTIRQVAREIKSCRMTLKRFMEKKKIGEVTKTGYKRTGLANQVVRENMETELADHIKALAAMFHGISAMKCRELAFEYAQRNGIDIPGSWIREKKTG